MQNAIESFIGRYGTPLLLCGVALLQIYNAHYHNLTPWKGGGFGMFSTVDSVSARYVHCYLIDGDTERAVSLPGFVSDDVRALRAAPNLTRMEQLATKLQSCTWIDENQSPSSVSTDSGNSTVDDVKPKPRRTPKYRAIETVDPDFDDPRIVHPDGFHLEVWRYEFDNASCVLTGRRFLELTSSQ